MASTYANRCCVVSDLIVINQNYFSLRIIKNGESDCVAIILKLFGRILNPVPASTSRRCRAKSLLSDWRLWNSGDTERSALTRSWQVCNLPCLRVLAKRGKYLAFQSSPRFWRCFGFSLQGSYAAWCRPVKAHFYSLI
jgi:hypothetical protein